jgi:transcription antitermination factor NusG
MSSLLPAVFDEAKGLWHVLHTKSRQEKALSADLTAMRLSHYLPLMRQIRHYGRHKTTVEIPLFGGYLFLRGTLDVAYEADRTRRVAHIIRVPNQQQLQWELVNLHLALESGNDVTPYPFLKNGVRAEVKSGPLRGLQGVIENRANAGRLILQVEMLGRAVSLEIDGALLEPIQ